MQLVPSALNFFNYIWEYMGVPGGAQHFQQAIFRQIKYWYLYPLSRFKEYPESSHLIMQYDDLVSKLHDTVEALYGWLNVSFTKPFGKIVDRVAESNYSFESDNIYTLNGLGLTNKMISEEFAEVFKAFHFEKQTELATIPQ